MNNEDWMLQRCGKITASRISEMLASGKGVTRANYAAELAASRMTGKPHRSAFSSASMDHGNEFEAIARIQYELRNGVMVVGTGKEFTQHPYIHSSGCSCDGEVGEDGLVEIKAPNTKTFVDYVLSGEIPSKYRWQMLWQLCVTRRKWCDFVAYDPDFPGEDSYLQIRFTPTEQEIKDLELEVIKFDLEVEQLIQSIISKRKK